MSKILYIGWFGLPEDAAGIRVYQVAKLLREAGNEVTFLCLSQSGIKKDDHVEWDGFRYIRKAHAVFKPAKIANIAYGFRDFQSIQQTISEEKPDTVILYNEKKKLTGRTVAYCHKRGITVGADVTEWYEISRRKGWDFLFAKNVDYRIRNLDVKLDYIISISPYLTDYYKSCGCKHILELPPIMDCIKSGIEPTKPGLRHIVYAGAPAQKDLLRPFLLAVKEINRKQTKVLVDLVGVSGEQVSVLAQTDEPERFGITAFGRIPHEDCIKIVERADLSVLFRENLRYAKAGFSTKLSESLSLGVPVLCNAVGGADLIIEDGFNGIKIEGLDIISIVSSIQEFLVMDGCLVDDMKQHALETAKRLFDGRSYTKALDEIVNTKR